jgi:hypothetical protein
MALLIQTMLKKLEKLQMRKVNFVVTIISGLLITTHAQADCNTWCGSTSGSVVCCSNNTQTFVTEPNSSLSAKENIIILLQKAISREKTYAESWFSSGTSLSAEREKIKQYKALLKDLGDD